MIQYLSSFFLIEFTEKNYFQCPFNRLQLLLIFAIRYQYNSRLIRELTVLSYIKTQQLLVYGIKN